MMQSVAQIRSLIAAGLSLAFVLTLAGHAQAGVAAPHRAIYAVAMVSAGAGTGITGVGGSIAIQMERDCIGWTMEYRSLITLATNENVSTQIGAQASTWESMDGKRYVFSVRHLIPGKPPLRIEGTATARPDGTGAVLYTHPKPAKIDLPRGTLFPVAHTELSLAAIAGLNRARTISRLTFDGMSEDGPLETNTVMTPLRPGTGKADRLPKALQGLESYNAAIAYFAPGSASGEPKQEMSSRIHANGVVSEMVIDFDEFVIRATLERLEMLKAPSCGG